MQNIGMDESNRTRLRNINRLKDLELVFAHSLVTLGTKVTARIAIKLLRRRRDGHG